MAKSPAFQFYPNDWLSSTHVTLMTPAQEGAYIRLLCHAWADLDCSLPDDDTKLAVLSRMGEGWLKGGSHLVRQCFVPHPHKEGRIVNERLLLEREKQRQWREKSIEGGIKSAKSRSKKTQPPLKGGSKMVATKTNSSSSSSSSNNTPIVPEAGLEGFEHFWSVWPKHFRKGDKTKCSAHWKTHRLAERSGEVISHLDAWIESDQWNKDDGQFIPSPLSWLRKWSPDAALPPSPKSDIGADPDHYHGRNYNESARVEQLVKDGVI